MQSNKARREVINYGTEQLEVFQLPDGSYQLSITQVGKSIEKHDKSFREFMAGNSPEALQYKGYCFGEILITGAGRPIKGVPIKIACAYWLYWAVKGDLKARALLAAGAEQVITQLADQAFGVQKSTLYYQQLLTDNIKQNTMMFNLLQKMYDEQQVMRQEQLEMKQELLILRPAYQELQTLNKSFSQLSQLKPLLEEIAKRIDVPNQKEDTIRGWLAKLNLNQAVSNKQAQLIGRLISDWLKIGNLQAPKGKPSRYPEAMVPLIKLATEYQLFYA